jgi:hypothetical protein
MLLSAEVSVSDSNVNPGSPLNNNNNSARVRVTSCSSRDSGENKRESSLKMNQDDDRVKNLSSSRDESDEESMRPKKYVRLVDRKLTRVRKRICVATSYTVIIKVLYRLVLSLLVCQE